MKTHNRTHFRQKGRAKALLVCGHWVSVLLPPHPNARLGCTAGLGCGYSLRWEKYRGEDGREEENKYWRKNG